MSPFLSQMSHFIAGDSPFHSQCHFVSLQCLKIFSMNRMLPNLSETDKDICVPGASSIIQPSWASHPDSSKLYFRGSITKRDHQSVTPTLKSPNWIPAYYRHIRSRTVRYMKALEGCGQRHLGLRHRQFSDRSWVTLSACLLPRSAQEHTFRMAEQSSLLTTRDTQS